MTDHQPAAPVPGWEAEDAERDRLRERYAAENAELLDDFERWLAGSGLAPKTVRRHVDNAWLYLDYLLREAEPVPAADGVTMAEGYFGWFFPRECLATPNSIGEQCATLRKLYGYMAERGLVGRDDYDYLISELRESKPDWIAAAADYDDWLDAIDRGEDPGDRHPFSRERRFTFDNAESAGII